MEVTYFTNTTNIFVSKNGQATSPDFLNGIYTMGPNETDTLYYPISLSRQFDGIQRLKSIKVSYTIVHGILVSISPSLKLIKYTPGEIVQSIATTSSYSTTSNTHLIGITTITNPVYTLTDDMFYRLELTITSAPGTAVIIQFNGIDITYDQRFPFPNVGHVIWVDSVYGNDITGTRHGNPFATIGMALSKAQSGDIVWILPGTYDECVTIPSGIGLQGVSRQSVIIQCLATNDMDLITMGINSSLTNVTLRLTSHQHHRLRGIVFPETTSSNSSVQNVDLTIDNSMASTDGSSQIYGVHSHGTGLPLSSHLALSNTTLNIKSSGGGNKYGIVVDTNVNYFYCHNLTLHLSSTGINDNVANLYCGAVVNYPGAKLSIGMGSIDILPVANMISRTLYQLEGTLTLSPLLMNRTTTIPLLSNSGNNIIPYAEVSNTIYTACLYIPYDPTSMGTIHELLLIVSSSDTKGGTSTGRLVDNTTNLVVTEFSWFNPLLDTSMVSSMFQFTHSSRTILRLDIKRNGSGKTNPRLHSLTLIFS
jgi:hypothetical protein